MPYHHYKITENEVNMTDFILVVSQSQKSTLKWYVSLPVLSGSHTHTYENQRQPGSNTHYAYTYTGI